MLCINDLYGNLVKHVKKVTFKLLIKLQRNKDIHQY